MKEKIDKQILEKILSLSVDGYWKNIVDNIELNHEWFFIKYSWHYVDVYKCIAIQLLRTSSGREMVSELYKETYNKEVKKEFENILLIKEILEILKAEPDSFMVDYLMNNFGHICVGINNTKVPFITADNPVLTLGNFEEKGNDIVYYPVTPDRCIFLFKRNVVPSPLSTVMQEWDEGKFKITNNLSDITQEAYAREKALWIEKNPLIKDLGIEDVIKLNTAIYMAANRFVVSSEALNDENKIIFIKTKISI